jgi:predicted ArsR family transcriptional regulator
LQSRLPILEDQRSCPRHVVEEDVMGVGPAERRGVRQVQARALNEKMWAVNVAFWEATGVFMVACECDDPSCTRSVEITPREYEAVRRQPYAFVVDRSHVPGDRGRSARYVVVELPGEEAAELAAETSALELSSHHFRALVSQLLDVLSADDREQALHDAGERLGRHLGTRARLLPETDLARGLEQICTAVRQLGFHASLEDVVGDTAVIRTPTCPLRPLVSERPEAATIDRGMWVGLVEQALDGVSAHGLSCETHGCLERGEPCVVTLRLVGSSA